MCLSGDQILEIPAVDKWQGLVICYSPDEVPIGCVSTIQAGEHWFVCLLNNRPFLTHCHLEFFPI